MKTLQYPTISSSQIKRGLFVIIFFALVLITLNLSAQTTSYQSIPATSSVKVSGSSNLHDWTMENNHLSAGVAFTFKDGKLNDMTALNLTLKVKELKSDEDLLNSRAYKAMDADKYSTINFKLSSASATPLSNGHYTIKAYGKLQIAGVTKDVILYADAVQNSDKTINCAGSEKLKMSDYGIKPPSFMFGALKVEDQVTINFNIKFKN
ncbi:MAG: YceI family protein [Bacteroidetes bacterium]|nr:YceI family protein [Bacteroidota bacterium]MBU1371310.1 YceI family protein [Bacteroidota bacterium]MBU1485797.1 YceI family protein [Bacteroidota bacterium]MBU1761583.1 YceI family protein [Bacteroidota bacterium]MBU2047251.1 YceI family protein [Bacteroidota bacterium]